LRSTLPYCIGSALALVLACSGSAFASAPAPRDALLDSEPLSARGFGSGYAEYPVDDEGRTVRIDRGVFSEADAQVVAAELGALVHGDEMNRLSVLMVTALEMQAICGADILACYDQRTEEMVIAGAESSKPPSRAFLVAHEYGHHVEVNRENDPWPALDWGTKRWATAERICPGVAAGRYQPGAYRSETYYDNPGEAFAESFAFLHYPHDVKWDWNLPEPDGYSFAAIREDVLHPWDGRRRVSRDGRLAASGDRDGSKIPTPLDGRLKLRLDGPAADDFDLRLLDSDRDHLLARTKAGGSNESLSYTVCGKRDVVVQAVSREGDGRYEIRAKRP